jgi:uncharacterized protein YigA (DUF484 family)
MAEPLRGNEGSLDADAVTAWLRANPHYLAERPDLYRWLAPPERVHGDGMADHMAAMLRAERAHAAAMAERADDVLAAGRAAAGLAARVQEAVLALIRAADPIDCVTSELPALLGVDAASVAMEALRPGARALAEGSVATLLGGRSVLFRDAPQQPRMIHGEAAELAAHDVLVRIPGEGPPALLALVARDRRAIDPAQGAGALAFLGRAVGAAMGR